MRNTALRPHATLPGPYDAGTVLATTVDARGNALWLLCPDAETVRKPYGPSYPKPRRYPYDALLVSSDGTPPVERTLDQPLMEKKRVSWVYQSSRSRAHIQLSCSSSSMSIRTRTS